MTIRDFCEDDKERMEEIAVQAFSVWTRFALDKTLPRDKTDEFFRRETGWYVRNALKDNESINIIVAEEDGQAVGYIVVGLDRGKSDVFGFTWGVIISLAVDPAYHDRGIGSALISSSLDWLRSRDAKYVEVMTDQNNIAAIRAYEKNNFRVIYSGIMLSQYLD